jgi:hypothetical protein
MILRVIGHVPHISHLMATVKISLQELLIITIRGLMHRLLHPAILDIVNRGPATSSAASILVYEGLVIHILILCRIMIVLLM